MAIEIIIAIIAANTIVAESHVIQLSISIVDKNPVMPIINGGKDFHCALPHQTNLPIADSKSFQSSYVARRATS
jgi:hypothetical protein